MAPCLRGAFVFAVSTILTLAADALLLTPRAAALERADVDALVNPVLARGPATAVVVGVVTPQDTHYFCYGQFSKTEPAAPNRDTLFEIGSVTKVFTGIALADAAARGEVKLDDPVRLHLPPDVKLPTRHGKQITLLHLATHTSGLPRIPMIVGLRGLDDPYAASDERELYATLRGIQLWSDPGETCSYSNLGFALLGHTLAVNAKTTYEQLIVSRICEPLGLHDTRITLTPQQRARLIPGHTAEGKPTSNWHFDAYAGCGALRSTAADLCQFVRANIGLDHTPLDAALRDAQRPRRAFDENGRCRIGLAWISGPLDPGRAATTASSTPSPTVVWHNGATGGYSSFVGFLRDQQCGVVVLLNATVGREQPADVLGMQLLRRLATSESADTHP